MQKMVAFSIRFSETETNLDLIYYWELGATKMMERLKEQILGWVPGRVPEHNRLLIHIRSCCLWDHL